MAVKDQLFRHPVEKPGLVICNRLTPGLAEVEKYEYTELLTNDFWQGFLLHA